jgi:tetratricopeptide (TPR) repeat protein
MTRFNAPTKLSNRLQTQFLRTVRNGAMVLALPLFTWMAASSTTALAQTNTAAAPAIRPEVIKLLQASQDALREGQTDKALTVAQQAMAMPNISKDERPYVLRSVAAAAMQAKNFVLAISTLESLVQELPDTTLPDQRSALIESILSAAQQAQDLERFVKWARIYLDQGGRNPSVRPVLIQTLSVLKQHEAVIKEVRVKMKSDEEFNVKTPEIELRLMAYSQRMLKDDAGYNASLKILLQRYPSKAYWAEVIPRVARQANFNVRFDLDLYRLLELTGNMEDPTEYTDMANLALKNGLPAEAARVVELAFSSGVFGKGSDVANQQKLRQQTQQKLNEDEKALPALEKSAKDANAIASLAEVYASKQQWELALTTFNKAIEMGGLRREAETRLHAGIVLNKLGKKADAQKCGTVFRATPLRLKLHSCGSFGSKPAEYQLHQIVCQNCS